MDLKEIEYQHYRLNEIKEKIENHLSELGNNTDISEYDDEDKATEKIIESIEKNYSEYFFYNYDAMEYLMKNDISLQDSLELAEEYGYSPSGLHVCILANLLIKDYKLKEFYENTLPLVETYFEKKEELEDMLETVVEEIAEVSEELKYETLEEERKLLREKLRELKDIYESIKEDLK